MASFVAQIELKEITATEFEYFDMHLQSHSFECRKKDHPSFQGKRTIECVYIRKGINISISDISGLLVNALFKTGKKYSFTITKSKHN